MFAEGTLKEARKELENRKAQEFIADYRKKDFDPSHILASQYTDPPDCSRKEQEQATRTTTIDKTLPPSRSKDKTAEARTKDKPTDRHVCYLKEVQGQER